MVVILFYSLQVYTVNKYILENRGRYKTGHYNRNSATLDGKVLRKESTEKLPKTVILRDVLLTLLSLLSSLKTVDGNIMVNSKDRRQ